MLYHSMDRQKLEIQKLPPYLEELEVLDLFAQLKQ